MRRLLVITGFLLVLTSCGEDTQTEYSVEVRSDFLAACADPATDSLLTSRLCVCVFDEAQTRLSFARFQELESRIAGDPNGPLPLALAQIVADCVISEASL